MKTKPIETCNGPSFIPDSTERLILTSLARIGDRVVMAVPSTDEGWAHHKVPNGTEGTVIGFKRVTTFVGRVGVYKDPPGKYEMNGNAVVRWDNGVFDTPSMHDLVLLTRRFRNSNASIEAFDTKELIGPLPDLPFWEHDIVRVKEGARCIAAWSNEPELIVTSIDYHRIGEFCDDGTTPMPLYSIEPRSRNRGSVVYREHDLELVKRGNVWWWAHDKTQLSFANLKEECAFHKTIGMATEVKNPYTEIFYWDENHIRLAAADKVIDAVNVSPGMFGSGPRATAYKFTDPDLSARANAELVKGFPIKVYHHAE